MPPFVQFNLLIYNFCLIFTLQILLLNLSVDVLSNYFSRALSFRMYLCALWSGFLPGCCKFQHIYLFWSDLNWFVWILLLCLCCCCLLQFSSFFWAHFNSSVSNSLSRTMYVCSLLGVLVFLVSFSVVRLRCSHGGPVIFFVTPDPPNENTVQFLCVPEGLL